VKGKNMKQKYSTIIAICVTLVLFAICITSFCIFGPERFSVYLLIFGVFFLPAVVVIRIIIAVRMALKEQKQYKTKNN
jgi:hypothetical protein